ncbi:carbamoyl phosphate synthase small subunit, partial [Streptomyces sp. NPDC005921]
MTTSTRGAGKVPAVLVLEDGRIFRGRAYGAVGETFGEAVFSTGMTGYQETLTDPSYDRQIVVATAPQIGNTGWNDEDDESSRIWVSGYVVRDPARVPSNWRAKRSLDAELVAQGVVGISGIDTRALTRHLRERGSMRAGVFSGEAIATDAELLARVQAQPHMKGASLYEEVATKEAYVVPAVGQKRFTVAAVDLGIKGMTPQRMAERGIEVHVLPATATEDDVYAVSPDGVFFSNGPGDPATADGPVALMTAVLARKTPLFGICFGRTVHRAVQGGPVGAAVCGHLGVEVVVVRLDV